MAENRKAKPKHHQYSSSIVWTGNTGRGTAAYRAYERTWDIITPEKPTIHCSNDPLLGGDPTLPNPEDLLLGRFIGVTLNPKIGLQKGSNPDQADAIHSDIHRYCFIARSLNFPVEIKANYDVG